MKKNYFRMLYLCLSFFCLISCNESVPLLENYTQDSTENRYLKGANSDFTLSQIDSNNWMKNLKSTKCLNNISIPGTHDSGALYEDFYGTTICQTLNIKQQLSAGIRFLDIRCRHKDDRFFIHHGVKFQNLNFDEVLETCTEFLKQNPSECIIMSVKEEYNPHNNSRSFASTFNSYKEKNRALWYVGDAIPTLQQIRGKVVLFRRFSSPSSLGIDLSNWEDNKVFTTNSSGSIIKVQDHYNVKDVDNKWFLVESLLNESKADSQGLLYLNFTSGYKSNWFGIPNIRTVATPINKKLDRYFNQYSGGLLGFVIMDFVNAELAKSVYLSNF